MRRLLALTMALFFGAGTLYPQIPLWQWAVQIASPGNEQAFDICTKPNGDLLLAGSYDGNLGLIFGVPFIAPNQKDGFVASYSSAGNFQWAIRIGGMTNEEVKGIATDTAGNIYVSGYFEGTTDFDPGLFSTFNLTSAGGRDGFLARYSSAGSLDWAIRFGGTGDEEATKVAVNSAGAFITGYSQPGAPFYSSNSATLAAAATQSVANCFTARYSAAGVVQWVASGGSTGIDLGKDIICDDTRVYVTGDYTADFTLYNTNSTTAGTLAAQTINKFNVFVAAYDLTGSMTWMTNANSSDDDLAGGIAQDSLRLYITGGFKNGTLSLPYPSPTHTITNQGGFDIYLAALQKSNGACQWVSQQTGSGPADEHGYVIVKQPNGHIVAGGSYKGALSYTAFGGPPLSSVGNDDIFISGFTDNGDFAWNAAAGGGNIDSPYGLATSTSGAVYACGEHANGVSFGGITLLNAAGKNIFIAKTGCEGVSNNTIAGSQSICAAAAPQTFTGSLPVAAGAGTVAYLWQQSVDQLTWTAATGLNTSQHYTASPLAGNTFFRRVTFATGSCTFATNIVTVTVDQPPSLSVTGPSLAVCGATALISANVPPTGTGTWSVASGGATIQSSAAAISTASNLSVGGNIFAWTITSGACAPSTSTLLVRRDALPSPVAAGPAQTICATVSSLTATTPSIGSGTWSVLSGSAAISAPGNPATAVTGLSPGTSVFLWTVINGSCPAATATVSIQRDSDPGPAVVSPQQTVCSSSATVSAISPTSGAGIWVAISGAATLTAPTSATTVISNLQTGSNAAVWTVTNGVCAPVSDTLLIIRQALPGPVLAAANQTVCATTASLSAATPTAGTGLWSVLTGSAMLSNSASPLTTADSLAVGNNQFQWTVANGVCPAASLTVSVQRDAVPGPVSVAPDQTICAATATIAAASPTVGNGYWQIISGSGSVSASASPTTTAVNLQVGANLAVWTLTNGVCPQTADTMSIHRDAMPGTVDAGVNQTVCALSATLSAITPTTGAGQWSVVAGSGTLSSVTSPTSQVMGLSGGVNVFAWLVTNGVCPAITDTVAILRDADPGPAIASLSQTLCAQVSTLSAIAPTAGTGSWSVSAGTATLSSPQNTLTSAVNLQVGANVFVWQVQNGVCPPAADTVVVYRDAPPSVPVAGPSQSVCGTTATLGASTPSIGSGTWSLVSGSAMIASAQSPTTPISGLPAGANVFAWTLQNGTCPAATDHVTVTAFAPPSAAAAGPDNTVCATNGYLIAASPSTGTGSWTATGPSAIGNPLSPTTSVSGLTVGLNTFNWSIANGVCPATSATMNITRLAFPGPALAGNDQVICSPSATLAAAIPTTGTGTWSLSSGQATLTTATSHTSTASVSTGTNMLVWSITHGLCTAVSDTVLIIRDSPPDQAITGTDTAVCSAGATITANSPQTGLGLWTSSGGTASIASASTPTTAVNGLAFGTNIFVWSIANGVCPPSSDTMIVYRDQPPAAAAAGPDQTVCVHQATVSGNLPSVGAPSWSVLSGGGLVTGSATPSATVTGLTYGSNVLVYKISNGVCVAETDTVELLRDIPPAPVEAGSDQTVCASSATLAALQPTTGSGTWSGGTVVFQNGASPSATVHNLANGINILVWTVTNGVCPPITDTMRIHRDPEPSMPDAGADQTVCTSSSTLFAINPDTGTGNWYLLTASASVSSASSPTTVISDLAYGENMVEWRVVSGSCPARSDTVRIRREHEPGVVTAGEDRSVCGYSATLAGNVPSVGQPGWSLVSGDAQLQHATFSASIVAVQEGTVVLSYFNTNGVCPPASDTVQVHVFFPPGPAAAGDDILTCHPAVSLAAINPTAGTGKWTVISGSGALADEHSATATVSVLPPGLTQLRWTITNGPCVSVSDEIAVLRDTVIETAHAGPDQETESLSVRLEANGSGWPGTWEIVSGSGQFSDPADPRSFVSGLSSGENIFRWTISQGECGSSSDDVKVTLQDFMIPNGLSPNGDGRNDLFHITGLSNFSPVHLQVFNRWGVAVFESTDYQNNWDGASMKNEALADDTYYYLLDVPGKGKYSGFITLKRK